MPVPEPMQPEPLTPADRAARVALQRQVLATSVRLGLLPPPQDYQGAVPPPGRSRHEVWEVRRLTITQTPEVRQALVSSSRPGRLLGKAVAELFGTHPTLTEVQLSLLPATATLPQRIQVAVFAGESSVWTWEVAEEALTHIHEHLRVADYDVLGEVKRQFQAYLASLTR